MRRIRSILIALILSTLLVIFASRSYHRASRNIDNFNLVAEQKAPTLIALGRIQHSATAAILESVSAAIREDEIQHHMEVSRDGLKGDYELRLGDDDRQSGSYAGEGGGGNVQETFYESLEDYATLTDEPELVEQIEQAGARVFTLTARLNELKAQGIVGNEILETLDQLEEAEETLDQVLDTAISREEAALADANAIAANDLITPNQIGLITTAIQLLIIGLVFAVDRFNAQRYKSREKIETQNKALVKTNRELALARKQAEEASRLKDEFLANMSHELRTPLNAIIGYTQIILEGISGELNARQRNNVERILHNSENLLALINDVLDIAKIEAGRMELVQQPFELRPWVDKVTFQTYGLAKEKNLKFQVIVDKELPQTVVGDSERLKQILLNLLSNAIKFTEKGGITVRIDQPDQEHWAISVADTGIGIPEDAIEYIFDEFRQVDGSQIRQFGGTGLGLAIARNLTMMMRGQISVTSKLGQGSVFTVTLPLNTKQAEVQDQVIEKI
jgi:signal transduction histidine kinase